MIAGNVSDVHNSIPVHPVPMLDLRAQHAALRDEIRAAIERVVESQHFILGPEVAAFEEELAAYSQCQSGIGVSSGTDALLVALMAVGVGPGAEVITTPYSFFATTAAIVRLGATPVFVDIDPATYNLDPMELAAKITPRTQAILPVHLFGQMAEMDAILGVAAQYNLVVIEDAAQAVGAEVGGRRAGSWGKLGCFSFYPSKNLGGYGDGGMVVTNDPGLAERIRILRQQGAQPKYHHQWVGGNFRLDALQAVVLRAKLPYLDGWTACRQDHAATYRRLFRAAGLDGVLALPEERPAARHTYHQFVLRCPRRDALMAHLKAHKIGHEVYYPVPIHLQASLADLHYGVGSFPHSERAAQESLAIPIHPALSEADLEHVVRVIAAFYG